MDSDHVIVLFLALVLVGAAVALAYSTPALLGNESENVSDASLASFETTEPYCGDPNSTSASARTHDIPVGEALVISESIPVASNDTTVTASLEEFGPQRYILNVERETAERTPTPTPSTETATPANDSTTNESTETAANASSPTESPTTADADESNTTGNDANETATATAEQESTETRSTPTPTPTDAGSDCHPTVEYNATIHITQPDEFTVLVTYDGELVGAHWRDGDDAGSFGKLPEQPPTTDGPNGTSNNSSALARPAGKTASRG